MADIQFKVGAVLDDPTKLQQKLQQQLNGIKTNLSLGIDNQKALQAIQEVRTQVQNLKREMGNLSIGSGVKIDNSVKTITNSGIMGGVKVQQQIANVTQGMNSGVSGSAQNVQTLNAQLVSVNQNMGNVNKQSEDLKDNTDDANNSFNLMDKALESIGKRMVYMTFEKVLEGIRDCVDYLKEYDDALTNIRIVTMGTREETEKLMSTYNEIGQTLGASTTDVASGAVDWLRQGYSTEDTNTLVQDSVILSKLALIDTADATQYLTSALKGYKLEASDAIGVIDQLVSIDLKAATSSSDLAEAIKNKCRNVA